MDFFLGCMRNEKGRFDRLCYIPEMANVKLKSRSVNGPLVFIPIVELTTVSQHCCGESQSWNCTEYCDARRVSQSCCSLQVANLFEKIKRSSKRLSLSPPNQMVIHAYAPPNFIRSLSFQVILQVHANPSSTHDLKRNHDPVFTAHHFVGSTTANVLR